LIKMYYRLVRAIINILFGLLARREVVGRENVPEKGPYIIVCNHLSRFDPPLLLTVLPCRATVLAADKYRKSIFGPLLSSMGAIFIRRGEVDRKALRECLAVLERGGILGVAPEGTRSRTKALQKGRKGVAYLVSRAGVPILPIAVTGTEKIAKAFMRLKRAEVRVVIGKSFTLPAKSKVRSRELEEFTDLIMRRIAELLPEEYRGVYKNQR
jgi:1-acyl-sn-glycerol-3-phosphate acyltransferase